MHAGTIDDETTNPGRVYRALRERAGMWLTTREVRQLTYCEAPSTEVSGVRTQLEARGGRERIEHMQHGRLHFYRLVMEPGEQMSLLGGAR